MLVSSARSLPDHALSLALNGWMDETFKVLFEGQPARWWKINIHRKKCHVVYQGWCSSVICVLNVDHRLFLRVSVWAFLINNLNIEEAVLCLWLIWSLWYLLWLWEPAVVLVLRKCKSFVMSLLMVKSWTSSCLPLPELHCAWPLRLRVLFSMIQPSLLSTDNT